MIVDLIQPLSPQERAWRIGLDVANFFHLAMTEATAEATNLVKKKDRSNWKLSDWHHKNYYKTDATRQLFYCPDDIQRRKQETLSLEEFTEKYEKTNTPLIIEGCTDDWDISQKWSHRYFYDNYLQAKFKVGEDDDGFKLRLTYERYIQYLLYNQDDSPLYLFESSLEDKPQTKPILDNFTIPKYFEEDLFKLAGEKKRPPYRWFIMGPERSGTTIHTDPLMTSAWNASMRGHKRWVVFGADVPKSVVKGRQFRKKNYDDEAINYFIEILPKIKQKYSGQTLKIREFIQYPGDTVFIPGGLWHAVINLDDTIAVTQNVMTHYCFDTVWRSTRSERKKFAEAFLEDLRQKDYRLYQRALDLNDQDNYEMGQKYCKQEVSLSFTPSQSSDSSSSSEFDSQTSPCSQQPINRVAVRRNSSFSNRSSSSQKSLPRSRQKRSRSRAVVSEGEKPPLKRRLSLRQVL